MTKILKEIDPENGEYCGHCPKLVATLFPFYCNEFLRYLGDTTLDPKRLPECKKAEAKHKKPIEFLKQFVALGKRPLGELVEEMEELDNLRGNVKEWLNEQT